MLKFLILSLFMVNLNILAQEEKLLDIQCRNLINMLDDINGRVSSDKQIVVESCEESFDTTLFGLVKKNFKSNVTLSSPSGLCSNAKFVEKHPTDLGHGVHLGVDYQRKVKALEAFGLMTGDLASSGGLAGAYLMSLHYPVCE